MITSPTLANRDHRDQRYAEFALEIQGSEVACFVSEAALHRWCAERCCDRANAQRLRRIAHEVVAAAMPMAGV